MLMNNKEEIILNRPDLQKSICAEDLKDAEYVIIGVKPIMEKTAMPVQPMRMMVDSTSFRN